MSANYAGNSIKSRENNEVKQAKPDVKKVTKGKVKVKKKSEISKIASNMISQEVTSIKEYAIYEVVIPVIKDTITQLVKGSIDMLFYGEVRSSSRGRSGGGHASKVSYQDYFDSKYSDRKSTRTDERRIPRGLSYDEIGFTNKADADDVLDRMDEIIEQYGVVRVADFFEMAGVTGNGPTDHNYGWTSINNARVERDRFGEYFIKIGRPAPIR